jgi:flagellar biosynthesis/type III secretory pathway chaperone
LEQHVEELHNKWMLQIEHWRQQHWNDLEEKHYECIVQYQREKEHKQNYEFWEASFKIDKMIGECRDSWLQNLEILNQKISVDFQFQLELCKKVGNCDSMYSRIIRNGTFCSYPTSTSRKSDDISFQSEPLLG